jgi:hypothetical protein
MYLKLRIWKGKVTGHSNRVKEKQMVMQNHFDASHNYSLYIRKNLLKIDVLGCLIPKKWPLGLYFYFLNGLLTSESQNG